MARILCVLSTQGRHIQRKQNIKKEHVYNKAIAMLIPNSIGSESMQTVAMQSRVICLEF